jgi:hypothetical protein
MLDEEGSFRIRVFGWVTWINRRPGADDVSDVSVLKPAISPPNKLTDNASTTYAPPSFVPSIYHETRPT